MVILLTIPIIILLCKKWGNYSGITLNIATSLINLKQIKMKSTIIIVRTIYDTVICSGNKTSISD
jgi:hypothetical protein